VDPDTIRRATRSIAHRGPDQQGVFETGAVSLGAVRLRIIDLEHGRQPMFTEDGDIVIVFNGEIYNHAELRRELEALGHRFDSRCDTEVVLRAFVQWDTSCFARLRGMFGVALWTTSRRRLVLARDRIGIKPLYVAGRGGDIYFASELKGILEHPEIERQISPQGLHHYLSLNYVPGPYTLVDGIEKLRPGHWLEWLDGRVRKEPYWRLHMNPDARMTFGAAKEERNRCCAMPSGSTWFRMSPWACGPAAAWTHRPSCITLATTRPRGSGRSPSRSGAVRSTKASISARSLACTTRSTTNST
jgi:asparagine synthase (glutamine-hydrolysing)